MSFARVAGTQNSYDSNSTNQVFTTVDGGVLANEMETVTVEGTCSVELPIKPFVGQRHRVMADGGTATLLGGDHPLPGGPYAISSGGSIDVTYDAVGTWIVNASSQSTPSGWLTQATWWVIPSTGDDANTGLTADTALKTYAELSRRLGVFNTIRQLTTVHLPEGLPPTDPISLSVTIDGANPDGAGIVHVGGVAETLFEGTLTAITPFDAATNQPWVITDGAAPDGTFGGLLGERLRITSGPRAGVVSALAASSAPKSARTANWVAVGPYPSVDVVPVTPQVGDAYAVESLQQVTPGIIAVDMGDLNPDGAVFPNVSFLDLHFAQPDFGGLWAPNASEIDFRLYQCKCDPQLNGIESAFLILLASIFGSGVTSNGGAFVNPVAGLSFGTMDCGVGGAMSVDGDFLVQANFTEFGYAQRGNLSVIAGGCMDAGDTGFVVFQGQGEIAGSLWGAGNAAAGVGVQAGCALLVNYEEGSGTPTITGGDGDFYLNVNPAGTIGTQSRTFLEPEGVYSNAINNTWANFDATSHPNGTGFGRQAIYPQTGAQIVAAFGIGQL